MNLRWLILLMSLAAVGLVVKAQQSNPKPTPGGRKDPGLFGGENKDKKDKDDDETTRAVAGYVRDEAENPLEGAIVQLKDTKSLRVRSYITKEDGAFKFFGLSTNVDYELRAQYKDAASSTRTLSIFDSRKQAVINLKVEPKAKEAKR